MSLQQIVDRIAGIFRAEINRARIGWTEGEELRRAEGLIAEENRRDADSLRIRFEREFGTQHRKAARRGSQRSVERIAYEEACAVLNVRTDASPESIAQAYRRSIATYHPDTVARKSPEEIETATRRTREFIEAFGIIRRYRSVPS